MTAVVWTVVALIALYFALRFSVAWLLRKPHSKREGGL